MNLSKLKHMITRVSTLTVVFSQIGIILNTAGVFDAIQLDKYKIITTSILVILEVIGVIGVYNTEPKKF
jgi:hypothetical protein